MRLDRLAERKDKEVIEGSGVDELRVVAARVIANKAVELLGYFVVIKDGAYDRCLGSSSMVPEEVSKGDNSVLLFKVGICTLVSSLRCQISPHLARGRAATRLLAPTLINCNSPKRAFI